VGLMSELQLSRRRAVISRLLLMLLLLAGCDGQFPDQALPEQAPVQDDCTDSVLSWDNTGAPFLLNHCTECHSQHLVGEVARKGAPDTINFNTREQAAALTELILATAIEAQADRPTMPPLIRLREDEKARMGEWLRCGAP